MNDLHPEQSGSADGRRASALLHSVTTDFAPDVDRLVQGGVARGRTLRRRRRVGTTLAAVAVIGILGTAAGVGSQMIGGDAAPSPDLFADSTASAQASPSSDATASDDPAPTTDAAPTTDPDDAQSESAAPIDATIAVSALDIASIVDELVPGGDVGETIMDPGFFVDSAERISAKFLYDGTLTSFSITSQLDGATCGDCVELDGDTLLLNDPVTADGVTTLTAVAYVRGYTVQITSANAAELKDAAPVTDEPALTQDELVTIVTSDRWFEEAGR